MGTRRLVIAAATLVGALLVGRWTVAALADRWWAATISPDAADFVTRWQLLGLALDTVAIVIATGWFAAQALLVARAIASVQVERELGNLRVREAVPPRVLVLAAVLTGLLLGVLTGAGARAWRVPFVLWRQGVEYGVRDPILGTDLGVHIAAAPFWAVVHGFVLTLVGLGLAITALLYVAVGGIRRENGNIEVHPDARRHIGSLLTLLAVVIGAGYLLAPYGLAASGGAALGPVAIATRITAMQAMAGASLAVAAMCITWAVRSRNSLVAAGWMVLAFGALVERVVVPAMVAESVPPSSRLDALRTLDAIAWGLRIDSTTAAAGDTTPSVIGGWDEALLARALERADGVLLTATPRTITAGPAGTWLTAVSRGEHATLQVRHVGEPDAGAVSQQAPPWPGIADPRVRPDAPDWRRANAVGSGTLTSRVVLAWARQAPGMLVRGAEGGVDWHLRPIDRARALVPMASWGSTELTAVAGRLTWVVQGFVTFARFPVERRATWDGARTSGAVPAFIATIDMADGSTRIFADPAADSLGTAWARFIGPLIEPPTAIPGEVRDALVYPRAWFEAQMTVLEGERWGAGVRPGRRVPDDLPDSPTVVWQAGVPARQAVFEDPSRRTVSSVVTGRRDAGMPLLRLDRPPAGSALPNARELERIWARFVEFQQLRDSARAAGDSVHVGAVRWHPGAAGLAAWQPVVAVPAVGPVSLIWIGTAIGGAVGGGRDALDAWSTVFPRAPGERPSGAGDGAALDAARRWMQRADSALARRDLIEFGRALEALRNALANPRR